MGAARTDLPLFARRLKAARQRAKLTQAHLGVAAGIEEASASSRVNQYERGKHEPDFLTVKRLAGALAVPTAYFYAEDDGLADLVLRYHALNGKRRRDLIEFAARQANSTQ